MKFRDLKRIAEEMCDVVIPNDYECMMNLASHGYLIRPHDDQIMKQHPEFGLVVVSGLSHIGELLTTRKTEV